MPESKVIAITVKDEEWQKLSQRYSRGEDLEGFEKEIFHTYPITEDFSRRIGGPGGIGL